MLEDAGGITGQFGALADGQAAVHGDEYRLTRLDVVLDAQTLATLSEATM